jgi:hypothetical protein
MLDCYCSGWEIVYSERGSHVPIFKFQFHSHDVSTLFTKCSHGMSKSFTQKLMLMKWASGCECAG